MAPAIAYRRQDTYHSAYHDAPKIESETAYKSYVFLGRYPKTEGDSSALVGAAAKTQYGPQARVFGTARYWVVYRVD